MGKNSENEDSLRAQGLRFPEAPGVYFFRNAKGKILYIGKAKNLKNRIMQYINFTDGRAMVRHLLQEACTVDFVITESEKAALVFEAAQIKENKPKYNVRLLDGGRFLHFHIDYNHDFPLLSLTTYPKKRKNHHYIGPFTDSKAARDTFDFVNKQFQLRTCSDAVLKREKRPCLEHGMHRCLAPCVDLCSKEEYQQELDEALDFLKGNQSNLLEKMKQRIVFLTCENRFDDAMLLRDQYQRIHKVLDEKLQSQSSMSIDRDYWGIMQVGNIGVFSVLSYRDGQLRPVVTTRFEKVIEESKEETLCSLLNGWYALEGPSEVLLPYLPESSEALQEVLTERLGHKVKMGVPQRGERLERLKVAEKNATASYQKMLSESQRRQEMLNSLKSVAQLRQVPLRIECFDNSHLGGSNPVSAMVVFEEGKANKYHYQAFHLKETKAADDYGAMREVLRRRLKRGLSNNESNLERWKLPQLIIVDGGRGQLNVALEVLDELDISSVEVIGFVKPRVEHAMGIMDASDKIVLPDQRDFIALDGDDRLLHFLQNIRNEAHNTSVKYQQNLREKYFFKSDLDDIEGVGGKMKKVLLKHFKSVAAIADASIEELIEADGVGEVLANRIVEYFRQKKLNMDLDD